MKTDLASPFDPLVDVGRLGAADADVACRPTESAAEREVCALLRHVVFVEEQSIFPGSDRDERDDDDSTIHLIADVGGVAGGTVRLYPLDDHGLWKGDRLAVAAPFRRMVVGRRLVSAAVDTAGRHGGHRMIATVQVPNTRFFEHLGWSPVGEPAPIYDVPHQMMQIPLSGAPDVAD